jgi:hypothetical protein
MARCYWAREGNEKFWIPGCHLALYQEEGPCHCREWEKEEIKLRPPSEDKEYKCMNRHLLEENERLSKLIDELKQKQ